MISRYSIFPIHFARRARKLIAQDDKSSLLYAALELRLGIESRIQSYLHASDQISKSLKKDWHVAKISKSLEKTASDGKLVSIISIERNNEKQTFTLKFIPLSNDLIEIYERIGQYLHYKESSYHFTDKWWESLSEIISSGLRDLEICAEGTLLGVPLIKNGTGEVDLKVEMEHDDERLEIFKQLAKTREIYTTHVEYIPVECFYTNARQHFIQANALRL